MYSYIVVLNTAIGCFKTVVDSIHPLSELEIHESAIESIKEDIEKSDIESWVDQSEEV